MMQIGQQQASYYNSNSLKSKSRILLNPIVQSISNVQSLNNISQNCKVQDHLLQFQQGYNNAIDETIQSNSNCPSNRNYQETFFIIKSSRKNDGKYQNLKLQSTSLQKSQPKGILKQKSIFNQQNFDMTTFNTNDITLLNTKRTKFFNQKPSLPSQVSFHPFLSENNQLKRVSFSNQIHFKMIDENICIKHKRYVLADLNDKI
ncbi:unnamed protein product [Paramecium pentaurelia]|uniref:Uncharacterized protein n=1 Tax=Paramecium pentaurelia TaxID=43138 RepID=A0A8S1WWH9_9CILI|nr:unnamed protein product [Paramecium pentaurelia]